MTYRDSEEEIRANAIISKDCARIGIYIESPWDLVGSHSKYEMTEGLAAIFAKHLTQPYPNKVVEGLMFAAARPETRQLLFEPVLSVLKKEGDSYLGQHAVHALTKMLIPTDSRLLQNLVLDETLRDSRGLLMEPYAKLAKKAAIPTLHKAFRDGNDFLKVESLRQLSKLGDQTIKDDLELLAKHPRSEYRKVARDGLLRLEREASRTRRLN